MNESAFDTECEFCAVSHGDANTQVLHITAGAMAFFPLYPATKGHTLVMPRDHVASFLDLSPIQAQEVMEVAQLVGRALSLAVDPEGMNLISSSGAVASQSVFHVHFHLVPRWGNDNMGSIWPRVATDTSAPELAKTAKAVRDALRLLEEAPRK